MTTCAYGYSTVDHMAAAPFLDAVGRDEYLTDAGRCDEGWSEADHDNAITFLESAS